MQPRDSKAILWTGLLAGTLDITSAMIHVTVLGSTLTRLFQYIASGLIGRDAAFSGGMATAALGLLLHYVIAFTFTVFYFLLYPRVSLLRRNAVISGIGYGLFVWAVMNLIVLPLSRIPPIPFDPAKAALAAAILIVCIGLPIALMRERQARSSRFGETRAA